MTHHSASGEHTPSENEPRAPTQRLNPGASERYEDETTLLGIWDVLWSQRALVLAITGLFAVGSVITALLLPPVYRSEAVLAPVSDDQVPDLAAGLGALTSLAGIQLGTSNESKTSVARLRSRAFAESFIRDNELMKLFYADEWDEEAQEWIPERVEDQPSMFDAVKYFREDVFVVQEDPTTGLVTAAIEWVDPNQAAQWVNELVVRINRELRQRALQEAEHNLAYLQSELQGAAVLELQQAIFRLIENEMKTVMLAKGREEYAFKVIDPGVVPTEKSRPRRTLIVITATVIGGFLAVLIAFLRDSIRRQLRARTEASGQ